MRLLKRLSWFIVGVVLSYPFSLFAAEIIKGGGTGAVAGTPAIWSVNGSGFLVPVTDVLYDIGTAALRVRAIYAGRVVQSNARASLAANYTNATTSFTAVASLSLPVTSGKKYTWQMKLFLSDSTAADGVKIDFNGGGASPTDFVGHCPIFNAVGAALTQANATTANMGTVINIAALTDTAVHYYACSGSFEPSTTGTIIPRAAQNAHTTGTLTILRGSYLWLEEMP